MMSAKSNSEIHVTLEAADILDVPAPAIKSAIDELNTRLNNVPGISENALEELSASVDALCRAVANSALAAGFCVGYASGETNAGFEYQLRA